ncbi:uncharacterized protein B0H18DRAFT_400136 [Fomitopsis serialis]|uniref:uncharacterized protein n=1 Tax=Fomitopsis serialis TaxID=139415 RepID=UPI002007E056|nr:uncharacterized protein B0H18DRAFT_400136 [Neoantrodia serialis]KAH9924727.1 hypothetical protein B0H18DRAFT_400136 [Neoantrodia serialis]
MVRTSYVVAAVPVREIGTLARIRPPQRPAPSLRIAPEKPPADGKRRRIGADPDLFAPRTISSSVSASSSLATNGATSPAAGPSSISARGVSMATDCRRLMAHLPPHPFAGLRNQLLLSTLRHCVNMGPVGLSVFTVVAALASKQTQSAAYLSQLIKEISPKTNPDIQNPYQTASVLPRPPAKKPPQRKPRGAEASKTGPKTASKPSVEAAPPAAEPALTSVETIEATMPTGSKRARPAPDIKPIQTGSEATEPPIPRRKARVEAAAGPKPNGFGAKVSVTHEDVDDGEGSPQKKQKTTNAAALTANGRSRVRPPSVEIVEVPDEDGPRRPQDYTLPSEVIEPDESSKPASRNASPTTALPPAPVRAGIPGSSLGHNKHKPSRPSGLRHQVFIDDEDVPEPAPVPPALKKSVPLAAPLAKSTRQEKKASTHPQDAKAIVAEKSANDLPTYKFMVSPTHLDVSQSAKDKAKAMRPAELRTYDLKAALSSPGAGPSTSTGSRGNAGKSTSSTTGSTAFAGSSSNKGFNWEGAGMAKPPPKPEGSWTCSTCMCTNDAKVTEKCAVCEAPRPGAPKVQQAGFDWGAVKLARPIPQEGSWTCSTCMCTNGAEVEEKCMVCEAPRPR